MASAEAASSAASAVAAAVSAASAAGGAGNTQLNIWSGEHVLAVIALSGVIVILAMAAVVLLRTPDNVDLETRKIRFAAATFTGILILFVFSAILYFADRGPTGKEIFEKAITAMTPLAGVIVGYLFGTRSPPAKAEAPGADTDTPREPASGDARKA
jgi:hypothetical protein